METASEGSEEGGIGGVLRVGNIVWVRRRNGSWWPGRVLGPEELAESQLMSPRSGTPVKLLGRDDASVDWYNLEKSKRVKPFRCGEFDACIERAEASQGIPIKKREKYARREDAILHALELEKQQGELKQQITSISCHASIKIQDVSERDSDHHFTEVHSPSNLDNGKFPTSARKVPTSLGECYPEHSLRINKNSEYKQSISGEDWHVIVNHLKEEDIGSQVVGKENQHLSVLGGSSNLTSDDRSDFLPLSGRSFVSVSHADIGKEFSLLKRKTFSSSTVDGTPTKRRDSVLQSSAKSPISHFFDPNHDVILNSVTADDHIGIFKNVMKGTSMIPSLNANVPLEYYRNLSKYGSSDVGNDDQQSQPGCTSNESTPSGWTDENDSDTSATDSELELDERKQGVVVAHPYIQSAENSIGSSMSKWHLKGKRYTRNVVTRPLESIDGKNFGATFSPEVKEKSVYDIGKFEPLMLNAHVKKFSYKNELEYDTEDDELFIEQDTNDSGRYHSTFVAFDDDSQLITQSGLGAVSPSFKIQRPYWEEPEDFIDQLYAFSLSRMMPTLVDVDLKVEARYPRERVPLVSLTSKLNGRAIIGHPVRIKILDDGSTDLLIPTIEATLAGSTSPPHLWRMAKRTSMHRVPRSIPDGRKLDSQLAAPPVKKCIHCADRFASGTFHRNAFKPLRVSSSQKTRTLSSFTSHKKLNWRSSLFGGLIKPDGSMPLVSCIPVKVVFSRILEEVGRPSSASVTSIPS
ncbi:Uncharacterized protein AXF42_Ash007087 [Apostasia shenzhenica]|uniref:PWWP domain-containing protein n=1 Tax=Apostasia shenzhenica TaxID=1088818 RepID=A0A2I0BF13_9ASPA|nr:Uncharacterized protein AXF42_Ash007087 [Apostasia shenzhenica]